MTTVLNTIISLTLISGTLALALVFAEKLFNNYGECVIDVNDGDRKLTVDGGSSLLASLSGKNIYLPSACGGKATCGLCKVQVSAGAGPMLPTEEPYLSQEERKQSFRLACQVKVKEDITILIPEALLSIRAFETTVKSIETLTHDIKGLRLRLPEDETINFKAGQYVQVHSRPYGKIKESVFRAYSIASAPSERQEIELIVRQVPEGICTTYVHKELAENETLKISGPYGEFYLRGEASDLIMIAGGSGLAPIRSIILDVLERKLDLQMHFFFGAVTKKDLYYLDEMGKLADEHDNFHFVPALSAPEPEDDWQGETGLITEVVDRHVEDGQDKEAYLCGSPGMINACLNVLDKKGIGEDKIFFDKF